LEKRTTRYPIQAVISKPSLRRTVLMDEISLRQADVPSRSAVRPPWALRRNNCKFRMRRGFVGLSGLVQTPESVVKT
jgi:hypothetical protein